jgi:hypothetical protein
VNLAGARFGLGVSQHQGAGSSIVNGKQKEKEKEKGAVDICFIGQGMFFESVLKAHIWLG